MSAPQQRGAAPGSEPQQPNAQGPGGTGQRFERLTEVMDRLRSPGGCAWDARQSHESLLKHLIEESYEVVEAVEAPGGPREHRDELVEELGDVLLQVVFHSRVAQEREPAEGGFGIDDVLEAVTAKLIRRHPQVFGAGMPAAGPEAAAGEPAAEARLHTRWEDLKRAEKPQRTGPFDGIPPGLPALQRAEKILAKARRHGLEPAVPTPAEDAPGASEPGPRTQQELGAALFEIVRQASAAGLDAERALREHSAAWARRQEERGPSAPQSPDAS